MLFTSNLKLKLEIQILAVQVKIGPEKKIPLLHAAGKLSSFQGLNLAVYVI